MDLVNFLFSKMINVQTVFQVDNFILIFKFIAAASAKIRVFGIVCFTAYYAVSEMDISISFGSNSFNVTTDENGIAILKINNVPAGEYEVKIQYNGNSHYKNTSAVHHAVILKIEKTRSPDEILQSGEYKKKIGDYRIVEYGYMGDMELALVEDSNGKKWIMSGDGFTSV